jgi:hypothetical protein
MEGVGAREQRMQVVDRDLLLRADADDLLREDIQGVARDLRLLDQALLHPLDDDRRFEQIGSELRENPALRGLVQPMTRSADSLQPAGDRLR